MKPLDQSIIDDISTYIEFKSNNDKNNFLENRQDKMILFKVTLKNERTAVELYTKFIYRHLLKTFNRFFTIKKPVPPTTQNSLRSVYEIYGE